MLAHIWTHLVMMSKKTALRADPASFQACLDRPRTPRAKIVDPENTQMLMWPAQLALARIVE
jgi:hypothetical protein